MHLKEGETITLIVLHQKSNFMSNKIFETAAVQEQVLSNKFSIKKGKTKKNIAEKSGKLFV